MELSAAAARTSEVYLTPDDVCGMVPGMTKGHLAQLRYEGRGGPKWLKPTARRVLYRQSDVVAWLEASERTTTAGSDG